MPSNNLLPNNLPTKFFLFANTRIKPAPIVGISVYKLGEGILLSNANIAKRIRANPARLND